MSMHSKRGRYHPVPLSSHHVTKWIDQVFRQLAARDSDKAANRFIAEVPSCNWSGWINDLLDMPPVRVK